MPLREWGVWGALGHCKHAHWVAFGAFCQRLNDDRFYSERMRGFPWGQAIVLELLTKRTEDRPSSKYVHNPPYSNDMKWLLKFSIKLGEPHAATLRANKDHIFVISRVINYTLLIYSSRRYAVRAAVLSSSGRRCFIAIHFTGHRY